MVKAGEEEVLAITEKLVEKAERKQVSKKKKKSKKCKRGKRSGRKHEEMRTEF